MKSLTRMSIQVVGRYRQTHRSRHSLMNLLVILRPHHVCKLVAAQCEKHVLLKVCCIVHLYQVAAFLTLMPRHACPLVYTTSINL